MSWVKNFGLELTKPLEIILLRHDIQHDTQHNDTQHNDTQHNDTQHNDPQHNDTQHNYTQHSDIQHNNMLKMTLSMTMLLCFNAVRVLLC
jgi:hypothetical protein